MSGRKNKIAYFYDSEPGLLLGGPWHRGWAGLASCRNRPRSAAVPLPSWSASQSPACSTLLTPPAR